MRLYCALLATLVLGCDSPTPDTLEQAGHDNIPMDVKQLVSTSCNVQWTFQQDRESCVESNLVAYVELNECLESSVDVEFRSVERCLKFYGTVGNMDFPTAVSCAKEYIRHAGYYEFDFNMGFFEMNPRDSDSCNNNYELVLKTVESFDRMEALYNGDLETLWQIWYGRSSSFPENMTQDERQLAIDRLTESGAFEYSGFGKGLEELYKT